MSSFGKIGWGAGTWGANVTGQRGEDIGQPDTIGHEQGTKEGTGESHTYLSISAFEHALGENPASVTAAHVRAYIGAHTLGSGVPAANDVVLKAKSWAPAAEIADKLWFEGTTDLTAYILARFRDTSDLGVLIKIWVSATKDLAATLIPSHLADILAAVESIPPADLPATFQPIPPKDLPTGVEAVPGINLGAIGGGHYPEDIAAILSVTQPRDLAAIIRGGWSGTADMGASLTQTGSFVALPAQIGIAYSTYASLGAQVGVISSSFADLPVRLQPIHVTDLAASLVTERHYSIYAIIQGQCIASEFNLPAILYQVYNQQEDLSVAPIKAVVSTHTSDKVPNLDKVSRPFFQNVYALGSYSGGLTIMALEPVFGIFPDLHAEIFARDFYRTNMGAYARAAHPETSNVAGELVSVGPFVNVSKLVLSLIPLLNIDAELIQVGGFLPIRGSLTPRRSASTSTSADAGFVSTATSYRFYLGTTRGLFIPPQTTPRTILTSYRNYSPTPDLHATVVGYHVTDFGASISNYPFTSIPASVGALSIDHISSIAANIAAFKRTDLSASLTVSGGYEHLTASLTVDGAVSDFGAIVIPYINPVALSIVTVSTVPLSDIGALINYDSLVGCAPTSMMSNMPGYIKPLFGGFGSLGEDLGASINVLSMTSTFPGEITGRKRTRIRILGLTFRAAVRSGARVRGSITPVIPTYSDLAVEIVGSSHESNLPGVIVPVRYAPDDVDFTATERVANLVTGTYRDVLVSFRSQVSSYVYEDITDAVYSTDRGTWAIDLRTLVEGDTFFDRSLLNRAVLLEEVQEFYSLDEAIRNALVVLCEQRQDNFTASLVASGAITDLGVSLGIVEADRMGNLLSSLVAVENSPDISASINQGPEVSSLFALAASLVPKVSQVSGNIGGSILGNISGDLGAEITAS